MSDIKFPCKFTIGNREKIFTMDNNYGGYVSVSWESDEDYPSGSRSYDISAIKGLVSKGTWIIVEKPIESDSLLTAIKTADTNLTAVLSVAGIRITQNFLSSFVDCKDTETAVKVIGLLSDLNKALKELK